MTGPFLLSKTVSIPMIPHYSFLANSQLSTAGISSRQGADEMTTAKTPLSLIGIKKLTMPMATTTADQMIILLAP